MIRISILGIGSPFGDDQIGWRVIDAINESSMLNRYPPGMVQTCRCDRPVTTMLQKLMESEVVIMIDAMKTGLPPGTICQLDLSDLQLNPHRISSHEMGMAECLALGRTLGILPRLLLCYGVEIDSIDPQRDMGDVLHAAVIRLVAEVEEKLADCCTSLTTRTENSAADDSSFSMDGSRASAAL